MHTCMCPYIYIYIYIIVQTYERISIQVCITGREANASTKLLIELSYAYKFLSSVTSVEPNQCSGNYILHCRLFQCATIPV